ncbi:unnamed protein product [Phytophthora fragariaefolia]|uniref:Unnamed protein product n=1 Tax=Phytophthora fragariaefolia TaxID=1490495 RepID=A0A9W6U8G1_9STRA|nr:unnamed protein product [Phytophthora fragariaefolia]
MKMAKGSSSAVPATSMKSGAPRGDNSSTAVITPQLDSIAEGSVRFDDDSIRMMKTSMKATTTWRRRHQRLWRWRRTLRSVGVRPLSRNIVDEFNEDDGSEPPTQNRQ